MVEKHVNSFYCFVYWYSAGTEYPPVANIRQIHAMFDVFRSLVSEYLNVNK